MLHGGLGALTALLALVPGWLYLRLSSRYRPLAQTSGLHEVLEVVAVGIATTGLAAFAFMLTPHSLLPFTIDIDEWTERGKDYLTEDVRRIAWTVVILTGTALIIATLLHAMQRPWRRAEFRSGGNLWVHSLGPRPKGRVQWVGIRMVDKRVFEGILHSYDPNEVGDERDIALRAPIHFTAEEYAEPRHLEHIDVMIVPARQIEHITMKYVPERAKIRWRRGRHASTWIRQRTMRQYVGAAIATCGVVALVIVVAAARG